jgi:hypothetical protein
MDRETRNLQQSKQKSTLTKAVGHVNPNDLTEGIPKTVYVKGSGVYDVVKFNNQIYYSCRYTSEKDIITVDTLYTAPESIYIGRVKIKSPLVSDADSYLKYNGSSEEIDFTPLATPADHASSHESGGGDTINHDSLTGFVAGEHLDPAQVVNVAKSGGDFTTIQGAINSITDATTTKRYAVVVHPGEYTESVTLKDYVDLVGTGRTNSIIKGTSGTVLTFPANKCTVSEMGINVDYGTLGANSTAITSAGVDSVLKDCDITVTKSGGDYVMHGMEITGGSFRMSDCYFIFTDTSAATATQRIQSAVVQTGTLTTVIMNNNELLVSTTDTNDDLVGFETTAAITGKCLIANNIIDVNAGAAGSSATGLWLYGTGDSAIISQNRITVNCNASSYGFWIDSTAGGAVVDTRHNEIIVTAVGAAEGFDVATEDTLNSVYDKITAKTPFTGAGTITYVSSPADGNISLSGTSVYKPDAITATSEGVAASIVTLNTEVTTNGDSDLDNVTLANGTSGQVKHIYCVAEGNAADTWKITPATMCGGTQITFAGAGEGCVLVYADNEGWVVVGNNGGTIT